MIQPPEATPPISYTWDNGDYTAATVGTLVAGICTLAVTATKRGDAWVTATHTVVITPPIVCVQASAVELRVVTPGPIYPDTEVVLSAHDPTENL